LNPARTPPAPVRCRDLLLDWGARTYVMGILNVTPDSFSGDGILDPGLAVERGLKLLEAGADILDIGGESTRPGSQPIGLEEELRRVIPIVEAIRRASNAPISIDTSNAPVAEAALQAGADIVNDVKGFRGDPELAGVAARHGALVVAMHNRVGTAVSAAAIGTYFGKAEYQDLVGEIAAELRESETILLDARVAEEHVIFDPGIGFGKTPQHNLELMRRLGELRDLGRPLLIGPSRKSFIGLTLDLPPEDRVEGTAAVVALGIQQGADIVRVHDLPAMARVARMADAIVRGRTTL
jgi:dihydropteroate synthase